LPLPWPFFLVRVLQRKDGTSEWKEGVARTITALVIIV